MSAVATSPDLLEQALAGRLMATIAIQQGSQRREWKVRLLRAEGDEQGIWAQPTAANYAKSTPPEIGSEVEVAFHLGHTRTCFQSVLLRHDKHFWLNEQIMLEAVMLQWPQQIQDGERRRHPRYASTDDSRVFAKVWVTGGGAFGVDIPARLRDMSLGGAGFIAPLRHELRGVRAGEPIRIEINQLGREIEIPAFFTEHTAVVGNNTFKFGVRFEDDPAKIKPEVRQVIEEIVADLARREEMRAKARAKA